MSSLTPLCVNPQYIQKYRHCVGNHLSAMAFHLARPLFLLSLLTPDWSSVLGSSRCISDCTHFFRPLKFKDDGIVQIVRKREFRNNERLSAKQSFYIHTQSGVQLHPVAESHDDTAILFTFPQSFKSTTYLPLNRSKAKYYVPTDLGSR